MGGGTASEPVVRPDLEAAYDQAKWAANMQLLLARFASLSDVARAAVGEPTRMRYGAAQDEELDLYRADRGSAPVVVFVHGGGWRGGSAREHGFLAEMLLAAGAHFIALDFSTVVKANGDLGVLVEQVRRALVWTAGNCSNFGGDANRIYVVGHSSGAHLAAMTLSTCWTDYGLRSDPIKGGVLISGIYDLGPLRYTSRRDYVHLDDDVERRLSPLRQIAGLTAPLLLAIGSQESPEFTRQTEVYGEAVRTSGQQLKTVVGATYNHFEILETLGSPYGLVGRHVLGLLSADG